MTSLTPSATAPRLPLTRRGIWMAAMLLAAMAFAAAGLLARDLSEFALLGARYTARAAFLVFVVTALAGPAAKLWPQSRWRALLPLRRQLGLATAILMAVHLAALAWNVLVFRPRTLASVVPGGITYLLIALLAVTSNGASQRAMGKWWRRLHALGTWAILVTFAISYSSRIVKPGYETTGLIFAPIALAVIAIKLAATWQGRRARA